MKLAFVAALSCLCLAACEGESDAGKRYRDASDRMVAARTFLSSLDGAEGITRAPSGLLYRINNTGEVDGDVPGYRDEVLVSYRGYFADGTQFDSSYDGNAPVRFALRDVIAGWREGLMMMPKGSSYTLYIPPQLGYGARGSAPIIPPNAALVYDVELLDVYRAEQP